MISFYLINDQPIWPGTCRETWVNIRRSRSLLNHVKSVFGVPAVRFVGNPKKEIRKVAVLGGDGNKYIGAAKRAVQMSLLLGICITT